MSKDFERAHRIYVNYKYKRFVFNEARRIIAAHRLDREENDVAERVEERLFSPNLWMAWLGWDAAERKSHLTEMVSKELGVDDAAPSGSPSAVLKAGGVQGTSEPAFSRIRNLVAAWIHLLPVDDAQRLHLSVVLSLGCGDIVRVLDEEDDLTPKALVKHAENVRKQLVGIRTTLRQVIDDDLHDAMNLTLDEIESWIEITLGSPAQALEYEKLCADLERQEKYQPLPPLPSEWQQLELASPRRKNLMKGPFYKRERERARAAYSKGGSAVHVVRSATPPNKVSSWDVTRTALRMLLLDWARDGHIYEKRRRASRTAHLVVLGYAASRIATVLRIGEFPYATFEARSAAVCSEVMSWLGRLGMIDPSELALIGSDRFAFPGA